MIRINCIHNDRGAWCINKDVKRSLCGIGARLCVEFPSMKEICEYRKSHWSPGPPKQIDFIQSMQKLQLKPGDLLIVKCPFKIPEQYISKLSESIKNILALSGFDNKIMILEDGMDIGVLSKGDR